MTGDLRERASRKRKRPHRVRFCRSPPRRVCRSGSARSRNRVPPSRTSTRDTVPARDTTKATPGSRALRRTRRTRLRRSAPRATPRTLRCDSPRRFAAAASRSSQGVRQAVFPRNSSRRCSSGDALRPGTEAPSCRQTRALSSGLLRRRSAILRRRRRFHGGTASAIPASREAPATGPPAKT